MVHDRMPQAGERTVEDQGGVIPGFCGPLERGHGSHGDAEENDPGPLRSILVPALDVLDSSQNVVSLMVAQRDESLVTRAMRTRIVQQRSITCSAGGHSPRQHLHTVAEQAVGAKQERIPPRGGKKPATDAHRVSSYQTDVLVRNPVVRRRCMN